MAELRPGLAPWRSWFAENQEALSGPLGPSRLLKLKFAPDKELPRLLRDLGLRYDPEALRQPLRFAAAGLPWRPEVGPVDLEAPARWAASDDPERGQRLGDLAMDARLLLELGQEAEALALARAIAALDAADDQTAAAVLDARSFLEGLDEGS